MRHLIITILASLSLMGAMAQNTPTKVRTLVVKTTDGKATRFNLSDISELTFEDGTTTVTTFLNLTPDFFELSGLEEGQKLTAGEQASVRLKATGNLTTFEAALLEHIHLHVNDMVIMPLESAGFRPGDEIEIPFTVPEGDCNIVACYAGQQQLIDNGFTMTLEPHPNATLYGVSPDAKYKYFDAYILTDEAYLVTSAEFKMGDGEWTDVATTNGCSISPVNNGVDNLFSISIRPDYQNVTGDVSVRITGEQHGRYKINWKNADAKYIDLERSTLPSRSIDGQTVVAELYVNDGFYLNGATVSDGTQAEMISRAYVRFTMPEKDVTIDLDFRNKIPVSSTGGDHVVNSVIYNAPDTYYGVPTTDGIPGEEVYLFAQIEDGYKPAKATTDDGHSFDFVYYGPNHQNLPYYCPVTISDGATSMTASISCVRAWKVSSQQEVDFDEPVYGEGETVKFAMKVPVGKKISTVKATTASGKDVAVTLDVPYGSFVMPAEDVTVTVTYEDISSEEKVTVIAHFDEDQYSVRSSTNWDWNFSDGFTMDKDATFYMTVYDNYGENFYVGVKIGDTATTYPASMDEDSGEYSFGKAFVATGNVVIKVGPTESSVAF